jgi:IMP cyclohydrolase
MKTIPNYLNGNPYPGRGILLGRSVDNACAVMAYFIMGRSENSRNRVFSLTEDGIRTEARDPRKMQDPSLIIYHPVRTLNGCTIVTNGDQTDTVRNAMAQGGDFRSALETRTFEPDAPNYTPRISGLVRPDGSYELSILKSLDGDPACCCRQFFSYDAPAAGAGHLIHTYETDGAPLPSFRGEPVLLTVDAPDAAALCDQLWSALDADNRISLFVRYLNLATGEAETVIRNGEDVIR